MVKFSAKKPVTVFVAVIVVLILGVIALRGMTPDLLPNMDFPYVVLVTSYPGAAPEAVEELVTRPIEQSMATLDDIETIQSSSSESMSMVVLQFQNDTAMDGIMVDILSKLDALKAGFDDMVGAPYIMRINPNMLPVAVAAVEMDGMSIQQLSQFANDSLIPELEGVSGVASVSAYGLLEEQVEVHIRADMVEAVNKAVATAVNEELGEAKKELDEAQAELDDARREIADGREELSQSQSDTFAQLAGAAQGVDNAVAQAAAYSAQVTALGAGETALNTERSMYEQALTELQAQRDALLPKQTELAMARGATGAVLALSPAPDPSQSLTELALDMSTQMILMGMGCQTVQDVLTMDAQLAAAQAELEAGLAEMATAEADIRERLAEIETALANLSTEKAAVQAVNDQVQQMVGVAVDSYQTIESGQLEAAVGFASADAQLAAAESSTEQAQKSIDDAYERFEESVEEALRQADISDKITVQTVAAILGAQDFDMPAGYVYEDGLGCIVSVGDEIRSVSELEGLMLFDLGMEDLEPIYLRDVAEVRVTNNAGDIYARLNGETGLVLTFSKQSSYPTAGVCDNITAAFERLSEENPGLGFVSMMDQGEYIYEIISSIFSSLLWGALFSVLVLLLFLRDIRPTFVTLCSIPISLMFALVLMYFSGVTLNMMSMAGLSISVGMLVDNSVVVIENTYRLRRLGESPVKAAVSGAGQVAGAVAASTITTICVFVPMAFSEGITKELFTDVALTMGYSLVASLIVSLTLVPAMACGTLKQIRPERKGLLGRIMPAYQRSLHWSLRHRWVVVLVAVLLLAVSAVDVLSRGFSFLPSMESTQISLTVTMPEDAGFEETVSMGDEVMARVMAVDGVDTVAGMMADGGSGISLMAGEGNSITGYITMDEDSRRRSDAVVADIDAACADLDCTVVADNGSMMSAFSAVLGGTGITVNVYARELEELQAAAQTVADTLVALPGVKSVDNGMEDPSPELHFVVDKERAMAKGLTVAQVYQEIALALTNEVDSIDLRFAGFDHSVIVKSGEKEDVTRKVLEDLSFSVTDPQGEEQTIYLRDIAELQESQTLSSISRSEQRRYLSVTAALAEGESVTKVTAQVETLMESAVLPEGVRYEFAGENETILEAMEDLLLMLVVGILLVYLTMVAQFQSLKAPFIVMFTIPLAFTGGFIALSLCGMDVNILSMLGFIMLTGVIVNNGIVLVDYINSLRLEGAERRAAIVEACATRMRPVLMTSITTILGMLVMALGRTESAMLMQPLAVTNIGGLAYGTLMTLFVVPVIYDLLAARELRKVDEADLEMSEK